MSKLVLELQADTLNSEISVSDLLRKAYLVAKKLDVDDFVEWISNELNGYPANAEIPEYRELRGEVRVYNPYHGWQTLNFENPELADKISRRQTNQPISQLVALIDKPENKGYVYMPFSEENANLLMKGMNGPPLRPALFISLNLVHGIVDNIRNVILKWSIELERKGVLVEGMTFSTHEKNAASSVTQITNIINSMSNSSILQNSPGAIQITQVITEKPNKEDLIEFTDKLESLIKQVGELQYQNLKDDLDKLKLRLDTIRLYLSSKQEDPNFIEESLKTTRNLLEGIVSSSIVTAVLTPELHQLVKQLLHQLALWLG